jgi:hypothetical protein
VVRAKRATATLMLPSSTWAPAISPAVEQPTSTACGKAARSSAKGSACPA